MSQLSCPHCGKLIEYQGSAAGQFVTCRACARVVRVLSDADTSTESPWNNPLDGRAHVEAEYANSSHDGQKSGNSRVLIYGLLGLIAIMLGATVVVMVWQEFGGAVAQPGAPARLETLDQWIRQLEQGPDEDSRREAARAIAQKGPQAVLKALDATTDVLDDGNTLRISKPVVQAMADVGPELVDTLGEALSAEEQDVRVAAASVLRAMGRRAVDVVEPLAAALDDENRWVRWFAAEALGNIGPCYISVAQMTQLNPIIKLVYIAGMLAGRLEIIPILMLFSGHTWK